jgi:hypothetical protein
MSSPRISTNAVSSVETKSNKGFFRSGLFTALIGALGVGVHLDRIIVDHRQEAADMVSLDVLLGIIFLALAIKGALRVLRQQKEDRY